MCMYIYFIVDAGMYTVENGRKIRRSENNVKIIKSMFPLVST
jgi:hypothetical protein